MAEALPDLKAQMRGYLSALAARGGRSRSPAKIAAARINAAKASKAAAANRKKKP